MNEPNRALAELDPVELDDATRWDLIRKALVFQLKLFMDGVKDLVLAPLVFVALFFDLFKPSREPGRNLGRVFRAGLVFEEWLDLYAPARDPDVEAAGMSTPLAGGFDQGLNQVEATLTQLAERGQINEKAKAALETLIGEARAEGPKPESATDDRTGQRHDS